MKRYLLDTDVPGILDTDEVTTAALANGAVTAAKVDLAGLSGPFTFFGDALRVGTPTLANAAVPKSYADGLVAPPITVFCPATVSVGDTVYLTGAYTVDKADATSSATMPSVAVVATKPTATTATVILQGLIGGYLGLTVGAGYFVDTTPGGITASVAAFVSGNVAQRVGRAISSTTLLVNVSPDYVEL